MTQDIHNNEQQQLCVVDVKIADHSAIAKYSNMILNNILSGINN